jgi:hypothetical protein
LGSQHPGGTWFGRAVRGETGTRRFAGVSCGLERGEVAIVRAGGGDAAEGELISSGFPRSMRFWADGD